MQSVVEMFAWEVLEDYLDVVVEPDGQISAKVLVSLVDGINTSINEFYRMRRADCVQHQSSPTLITDFVPSMFKYLSLYELGKALLLMQ